MIIVFVNISESLWKDNSIEFEFDETFVLNKGAIRRKNRSLKVETLKIKFQS